jgi:glycosyltransferase involved in cell wall biosynthesis
MSQLLHIGVGAPGQSAGGLNRYVADLLSAQRAHGIDSEALVFGADPLPAGFRSAGSATAPLPIRLTNLMRALKRGDRPKILDVHFGLYGMPAVLAMPDIPVVCHFHGPWAAESRSAGSHAPSVFMKEAWEKRVYRKAAHFVTLSNAFANLLAADYGVAMDAISVIPPGVDTNRFAPGERAASRDLLGLPQSGPIIVACRRLVPRMGLSDLILAIQGLPLCLVMVGDGPEHGSLVQLAAQNGTDVRFLGRVADATLVHAYRAADLSVIPSRELEGFGLIALESLACGTPVVARPVGGLIEALAGLGKRAVTSDMSVSALREAIQAGLAEPTSAEECRSHALRFSWQMTVEKIDAVYHAVRPDWSLG